MSMRLGPLGPFKPLALSCAAALAVGAMATEAAALKIKFGSSGGGNAEQAASSAAGSGESRAGPAESQPQPAGRQPAEGRSQPVESPAQGAGNGPSGQPGGTAGAQAAPGQRADEAGEPQRSPEPVAQAAPAEPPGAPDRIAGERAGPEPSPAPAALEEIRPAAEIAAPAPAIATDPTQSAAPPAATPAVRAAVPAGSPDATSPPAQAGKAPEMVTRTSYSKRRRQTAGSEDSGARSAAPAAIAGGLPAYKLESTTCMAGCSHAPGEVVHQQIVVAEPQGGLVRTAGALPERGGSITCIGGCYDDGPKVYPAGPAGAGTAPGLMAADGVRGRVVPTSGHAPAARPGSGDWMMRINRERAGN